MSDEFKLTYRNIALTIEGLLYVPYPSGTYAVPPDEQPLFLENVLVDALTECGLQGRAAEIMAAIDAAVEPRFRTEVERLEQVRQQIAAEEEHEA